MSDHGFSKLILEMLEANKHMFYFQQLNMDIKQYTGTNKEVLCVR